MSTGQPDLSAGSSEAAATNFSVVPLALNDPSWRELSKTGVGRTSYHSPELVAGAAAAYGLQFTGWAAWQGHEMVGGIMLLASPAGHPGPLPVVAFNGPVIRPSTSRYRSVCDRHTSRIVSALIGQVAATYPAATIRIHPEIGDVRAVLESGWSARPTFTYEMDIACLDEAWNAMDRNRRRLIRRAEQHGYSVETITEPSYCPDSLVQQLVRLQMLQLATYGPPVEPDSATWRQLIGSLLAGGNGRLFVAYSPHGTPVAFQLTVVWGDRAGNMFTGSDPSHADLGANSLLRWRAAQDLHVLGVRRVDLNGARPGPAGRFKASLGAVVTERWDLWRPDGHPPPPPIRRVARRLRREAGRLRTHVRRRLAAR